jgi:hypothetical protein
MTEDTKTRRLGAVLYHDFELLDLYGPLEMFGCLGPEMEIVTVAEHADADRDPFAEFLDQGDLEQLVSAAGTAHTKGDE